MATGDYITLGGRFDCAKGRQIHSRTIKIVSGRTNSAQNKMPTSRLLAQIGYKTTGIKSDSHLFS